MSLTKDQIRASKPERIRRVLTPEWGGDGLVYVKALSANERDQFESDNRDLRESGLNPYVGIRARLAVRTVCDETEALLFSDDDVDWLGKEVAGPLDRIAAVAMELCGMTNKDAEQLAAQLKNSRAASSPSA